MWRTAVLTDSVSFKVHHKSNKSTVSLQHLFHLRKRSIGASQFGSRRLLQQCPHVQQRVHHCLSQLCCGCFFAAIESRHCKVDVVVHGVVAHTVPVGDNRAKAHDAVGLGWDLFEDIRSRG